MVSASGPGKIYPPRERTTPPVRRRPTGLRRTDKARAVVSLPLTGVLPAYPLVADNLARVPAWCGRTNLRFGTCGPCMSANSAIQAWSYLLSLDVAVGDDAVYDLYRRSGNPGFDPATGAGDDGVDMTVMLAELVWGGITITRATGQSETVRPLLFARVPFPPYENLHALTAIFGGAALAVDLDAAQESQTDAGLWDYVAGSPAWGGHAVWGGAYTSAADPHARDESLITWMHQCGTTSWFLNHQLSEVYVIVWPALWDHPAFTAGVDRPALVADFEAVTGRAWTGPDPGGPPPDPAGGMDAATRAFLTDPVMRTWAGLRHTNPRNGNQYAANQYNLLRHEEGLS